MTTRITLSDSGCGPGPNVAHQGDGGQTTGPQVETQTTGPQVGTQTTGPQVGTQTTGPQVGTQTTGPQVGTQTTGPQVGTQTTGPQVGTQATLTDAQVETIARNELLKVFIDKEVEALKMSLSADNLQRVRGGRKDVKQYITQAMLSCRTADDQLLCNLGPGPVVQASDNDPDPAGIRPETVLTDTVVESGFSC